MPATLKNVTTADGYKQAATLEYMGSIAASVVVANAAAVVEFDESEDGRGVWGAETFWAPFIGWYPRRCSGIRFRSAVPGQPAQVSCQLLNEDETSGVGNLSPFTQEISPSGGITNPTLGNVIAGIVNADGSVAAGTGFEVTPLATARYRIDFTPPLAAQPVVSAIADGDNPRVPTDYNRSAASVSLFFQFAGGADTNVGFSFTAIVPT